MGNSVARHKTTSIIVSDVAQQTNVDDEKSSSVTSALKTLSSHTLIVRESESKNEDAVQDTHDDAVNQNSPEVTPKTCLQDIKTPQTRKEAIYVQTSEFPYTRPKTINPVYRNKHLERVKRCHANNFYEAKHLHGFLSRRPHNDSKHRNQDVSTLARRKGSQKYQNSPENLGRHVNVLSLNDDRKTASNGCLSYSYNYETCRHTIRLSDTAALFSRLEHVVPERRKHFTIPESGTEEHDRRIERQEVYQKVLETISAHMANNENN